MAMQEMSSYTVNPNDTKITTMWELFEEAAKAKYGYGIKVIKTPWATKQLNNLDLELTDVIAEKEPREATRTIIDINMKEYTNRCEKEVDETLVKVQKVSSRSTEDRYHFSTESGVTWGIGANIGAQVMGMAMVGGSAGISGNYGKHKSTTTGSSVANSSNFGFTYEQQEKISVPPMTRVKAKITTYSMKYEQGFVVRFGMSSTFSISVTYKTRCQQSFCGSRVGYITAAELFKTLPDFRNEDGKASFCQPGTLSWFGEGSTVDKIVEPIEATYLQ